MSRVTISDDRYGKRRKYTIPSTYKGYRGTQTVRRSSLSSRVMKTPYVTRAGSRTVRTIKNAFNPGINSTKQEIKTVDDEIDVSVIDNDINSNANTRLCNQTLLGTGMYRRIGSRISMKSLRIVGDLHFYQVQTIANVTTRDNWVRMVILYTNDHLPALPTFSDVMKSTKFNGTVINSAFSGLDAAKMGNYSVLRDKIFEAKDNVFPQQWEPSVEMTAHNTIRVDEYIDLGGVVTTWDHGDSVGIDLIQSGALIMLLLSHHDTTTGSHVAFFGTQRMRFYDN